MAALWRVELLGGLRAVHAEREVTRFRTQKTGALLAWLAWRGGERHPREALIELLWPERATADGRNSLSVALSSLRSQLEPPGVAAGTVIQADRATVGLNPAAFTTDVDDFRAALQAARQSPGDTARVRWLSDAVALYRGPLLHGYYEDWVATEQRRQADDYYEALDLLVAHHERTGELATALAEVRRGIGFDPLRQCVRRSEMRLLAASGLPAAALEQYEDLAALLRVTLDVEPEPATVALADEIRRRLASSPADSSAPVVTPTLAAVPAVATPPAAAPTAAAPAAAAPAFAALPQGTVTLLCTDVESPAATLDVFRQRVRESLARHHGHEAQEAEGAFRVAFGRASDALACALEVLRAVVAATQALTPDLPLARLALHTGEVPPTLERSALTDSPAAGPVAEHATRLLLAAHPGQCVCSETTAALLRRGLAPGTWFTDLGAYRLQRDSRPERVYQVDIAEAPQQRFPPLRAAAGHANHLPLQLTRFVGREAELDRLDELLLDDKARLVTITGPGGTGKTRLSLEAATRLLPSYSGAVWFVPLAETSDPARIVDVVRDTLGLPGHGGDDPLAQVAELLASQPSLLVLDNFEQLVATGSGVVWQLLQRVPTVSCLVSSRQCLGLAGERELALAPLPIPAGPAGPEQLLECASVRLFVDRAQAVRPDFQVTASNAGALAELCGRLEGMPLALELAAARTSVLSPAQILERLSQLFDLLVSRRRDVPERHRTLRAAVDWSYDLLTPELQQFFASLAVFAGGWTLEAAEAVCDNSLALDHLAELRECSLVRADGGDQLRLGLLETIRAYGEEKLEQSGRLEAVRERHFRHFLSVAEAARAELEEGGSDELLDRLEAEQGNFQAALNWALERELDAALALAGVLWRFWLGRGHWTLARAALERCVAQAAAAPPRLRERALGWLGHLAYRQSDYARAEECLREALALSRELGDHAGVGNALNELGKVAWALGDYDQARNCYGESLAIRRELGNAFGVAASLHNLSTVADAQGDRAAAAEYLREGLAIRRELGDQRGVAASLTNLGALAHGQREYAEARRHLAESLAIRRELGDMAGVATCLNDLGGVDLAEGHCDAARAHYNEALATRREIGDRRGAAVSLSNLGVVEVSSGHYAEAHRYYEESLALRREIGDRRGMAQVLVNLGDVAMTRGNHAAARPLLEQALAIQRQIGDRQGITLCLANLGEVAAAELRWGDAREAYTACLDLLVEPGDDWLRAHVLQGLAQVHAQLGTHTGLANVAGD